MSILPAEDDNALPDPDDDGITDFIAQLQRSPLRFRDPPRRSSAGASIAALQPHPDDLALSFAGVLLQSTAGIELMTVYSKALRRRATRTRHREDRRFARQIGARLASLPFRESDAYGAARDKTHRAIVLEQVWRALEPTEETLLLAPAGVARHPDHVATSRVAADLGCCAFWEDVAFWGIYASSIEDRVLFSERCKGSLGNYVLVGIDITAVLVRKARLLACYSSQSRDVWRPIRYHWAAAKELGHHGYCERAFVSREYLPEFLQRLNLIWSESAPVRYGTIDLDAGWASFRTVA